MSFNQVSGKIHERRSFDKSIQIPNNKISTMNSEESYRPLIQSNQNNDNQKIQEQKQIEYQKYALPWIKQNQKQKQKQSQIQDLKYSRKMEKQYQNNYYENNLYTEEQNTKNLKQLKNHFYNPWNGKIKKQQEHIILNYLNGKVQLLSDKKRKNKRHKSFINDFQQQCQKEQQAQQQFVVVPVTDLNRYKKSISTYKKSKKLNNANRKKGQQSQLKKGLKTIQRQYQNKNNLLHMSMLLHEHKTLQKQNKIITQLKSKISNLQRSTEMSAKNIKSASPNSKIMPYQNLNKHQKSKSNFGINQYQFNERYHLVNSPKESYSNSFRMNPIKKQIEYQPQVQQFKWKNMEKIKLLKKDKNHNLEEVQVIKPQYQRKTYQKNCNLSQSNYSVVQKNQLKITLNQKRNKTQTKCQTNHRFSTSRMSKISQNHEKDSTDNLKRVIYYQKDISVAPSSQTLKTKIQKNLSGKKIEAMVDKKKNSISKIKKSNEHYLENYGNSSCTHYNQHSLDNNKQISINKPIRFPLRIPSKGFLQIKTYYSQAQTIQAMQTFGSKSLTSISAINKKISRIKPLPSQSQLFQFIQTYIPQHRKINISKLMQQQNFKIVLDLDEGKQLYFGQMSNGSRSGLGVNIKENYMFQGIYKSNYKMQGIQISEIGKYVGEFKNNKNKKQGKGQFLWRNGQYYNGQWLNGKKHGNGIWSSPNGDHYIGDWKDGKVQGQGVHTSLNGQHYEGSFKNYLKSGWGKQTLPNGDSYQGDFLNGKPNGKGTYRWSSGQFYQGQFKNGSRQNIGILEDYKGNQYKGHFKNQQPSGFCQIQFSSKDFYQGIIQNGFFNGRGTLKLFAEKQIWNGYWINDQFIESIK